MLWLYCKEITFLVREESPRTGHGECSPSSDSTMILDCLYTCSLQWHRKMFLDRGPGSGSCKVADYYSFVQSVKKKIKKFLKNGTHFSTTKSN